MPTSVVPPSLRQSLPSPPQTKPGPPQERPLVLLTLTFDPQRDHPEQLAHYAENWKADPKTWHFLTGEVPDVERVTTIFGMDYFPEEGLMDHSLHTAIIGSAGQNSWRISKAIDLQRINSQTW